MTSSRSTSVTVSFLLLLAFGGSPAQQVSVELGAEGETLRQKIDAPNLQKTPGMKPRWKPLSTGVSLPTIPVQDSGAPAASTDFPQQFPAVTQPADQVAPTPATGPAGLEGLVPAPGGGGAAGGSGLPEIATISGNGGGTWDATSDGSVVIEPSLFTYDGAKLTVRLFDAGGNEVTFGGAPLMEWSRRNDKDSSPLQFRGNVEGGSMVEQSPGDFSPREGIRYTLDVTAGQRISVEVSGQPLRETTVRLRSDALQ